MKELRTIVLAAGKGTRMKSKLAKVLHPVCGRPLIQYVVDVAQAAGSLKTYVVLGYQSQAVREYLDKNIATVLQKRLLGTADAVKSAAPFLKTCRGDVLILCGDTPLLRQETIKDLVQKHRKTNAVCTFLTACVDNPAGYGRIVRGTDCGVLAIREDKDATDEEKSISEINVGVYCFHCPSLLSALSKIKLNAKKKEFYLTDVVELLVREGRCVSTVTTKDANEGLGINTREDLAVAGDILRQRIVRKWMLAGVTVIDPRTTFIDADAVIGQDTVIRPFVVIEGNVRIGKNCTVGPFTRLRPGTRIHDHAQIGNFAEVSRSSLGVRSLMKHFSFLGDAQVGSQVNIGAGVVTANYDGRKKNVTHIADGAFIGSDSILVAPVKVGKKAVTGAGSVVKKGTAIPPGRVAVGVPARIIARRKSS